MKIAVLRPATAGWLFAAGTESSWSLRLNRHNYEWWRRLVVQARENYGDGLAAAINATASLYDDAAWRQLVPGAELRHGIGRTLWDGRDLVRISGGGHIDRTPWQPGDPAPPGSGIIYWSELMQLWTATYLQMAKDLSVERYGPQWPERVPELTQLLKETEE
ncbi:MAG: hypothetical protein KatS3mg038_2449 [Candidatus Kapaibacterium sp.]|nr:MAG: hypothetical protein KatS3mg038_2449 [Candidatus Kapabacteria bacterium]